MNNLVARIIPKLDKRSLIVGYSNMQCFAKNLKKFRLAQGYTRKTLSEIVNISVSYLCRLENAKCYCSFNLWCNLADALNVQIHEFFNHNLD